MKRFNFVLFSILVGSFSLADRVGNGGDIAEKNVILAYSQIPKFIENCLQIATCAPLKQDQILLENILSSYQMANAVAPHQLQFISPKEHPEIFGPDQADEIWITRNTVGSPIYINSDKINSNVPGENSPITIEQAFRFLFVALGTQLNIQDLIYLDHLAFRIVEVNLNSLSVWFNPPLNDSANQDMLPSDQWVRFFFNHMTDYLNFCLQDQACFQSQKNEDLIKTIIHNMKFEFDAEKTLHFLSGQQNPALFTIDGIVKSAVTGLAVQDPIYFNTDRLYTVQDGRLTPLRGEFLFALLLHELGHHAGVIDHSYLDLTSSQIAAYLQKNVSLTQFEEDYKVGFFHKAAIFRLQLFQNPWQQDSIGAQSKIIMADEVQFFDFIPHLEKNLTCPTGKKMLTYRINSAKWNGKSYGSDEFRWVSYIRNGKKNQIHIELQIYDLAIDASLICQTSNGKKSLINFKQDLQMYYSILPTAEPNSEYVTKQYIFERVEGMPNSFKKLKL